MTVDRELIRLMTETISVSTATTTNEYGVLAFSTSARSLRARVTYRDHQVRDRNGAVMEARGTVWCAADSTHAGGQSFCPSPGDRLTLPDGSMPIVMLTETFYDDQGPHHHKVAFGY